MDAATKPVVPLTPAGPDWNQREYVACAELGIGFTAQGSATHSIRKLFHYHFPGIGCCSIVFRWGGGSEVIYHDFEPTLHWIAQCRAEIRRLYP